MSLNLFPHTPVAVIPFAGRDIYLKRDDLLDPAFSGNKARKFAYFLAHEFAGVERLISHGSAQSNSLYSLSELAKRKGWQCDFYVDHIASHIVQHPQGNYAAALANGANIIAVNHYRQSCAGARGVGAEKSALIAHLSVAEYIERHILPKDKALFIPEGGRCDYALYGLRQLAAEIYHWAQQQDIQQLQVFLPSGTGTTALFLNQALIELHSDIRVVTCAAVGDDAYLRKQFTQLQANSAYHPRIVNAGKKYHFGQLYRDCYLMWQRLCKTGVEFELLYDPLGFIVLEHYLMQLPHSLPIMYLHQGGILGNHTMLPRYQRKFPELSIKSSVKKSG